MEGADQSSIGADPVTEAHPEEIRKRLSGPFLVAVGRGLFYTCVVALALRVGFTAVSDHEMAPWQMLALTSLFFPFIAVYAFLFELADENLFPASEVRASLRRYLTRSGPYFRLGVAYTILGAAFVIGTLVVMSANLLPVYYFFVPSVLPLSAAGFLFSSRYQLLHVSRGKRGWGVRHLTFFWILVAFVAVIYFLTTAWASLLNANAPARTSVALAGLSLAGIMALSCLLGWLLDREKEPKDEFVFESPFAREPVVIISTVILPYVTGWISGLFVAQVSLSKAGEAAWLTERFEWGWLFSTEQLAIVGMLFFGNLVFELMRYLGRYNEAPLARRLRLESADAKSSKTRLSLAFLKSARKYVAIFVAVLSGFPVLAFLAGFRGVVNQYLVAVALGFFTLVVFSLWPYERMGFRKPEVEAQGGWLRRQRKTLGQVWKERRTLQWLSGEVFPSYRRLIGIRVVGAILVLLAFLASFEKYERNWLRIRPGRGAVCLATMHGSVEIGDAEVARGLLDASMSPSYEKKLAALRKALSGGGDHPVALRTDAERLTLFESVRLKQFMLDRLAMEPELERGDWGWLTATLERRAEVQDRELFLAVLSASVTILVGLLLSSLVGEEGAALVSSGGIVVGVCTQALVVGTLSYLFFVSIGNGPGQQSSDLIAEARYLIRNEGHGIYLGATYVVFSLGLFLVSAMDRLLRGGENEVR